MWTAVASFAGKYVFEIIAAVCFAVFIGVVVYTVQNWCNHACRTAKAEAVTAKAELAQCKAESGKALAFYLEQVAKWEAQVAEQRREIEAAKVQKAEIVDKGRRSFEKIFKEKKTSEQQSRTRIAAEVRPNDVVIAPLALVREYNEAVAASPGAAQANSGSEIGISKNPASLVGEVGTFDALAVAQALLDNLHKYNQLAVRCNALVEIVTELEATHGNNTGGSAGKAVDAGGNVPSGAVAAQIF